MDCLVRESLIPLHSLRGNFIMKVIKVTGDVIGVSMSLGNGSSVKFFSWRRGVEALRVLHVNEVARLNKMRV